MEYMGIAIKRIYEEPAASDGFRVLVDRLWPRGMTKERAALDLWLKAVSLLPRYANGSAMTPRNSRNSKPGTLPNLTPIPPSKTCAVSARSIPT